MSGDRERCLRAGADEHLTKPLSLRGLVTTIERLMRQARAAEADENDRLGIPA